MQNRARLPRQPSLRRDPSSDRNQPVGGQSCLRQSGHAAGPARATNRLHGPALRHQHHQPVCLHFFGDVARQAGCSRRWTERSGSDHALLAGRGDGMPWLRRDRDSRGLHGDPTAALASTGSVALHSGGYRDGLSRPGLLSAHVLLSFDRPEQPCGDPRGLFRQRSLALTHGIECRSDRSRAGLGQRHDSAGFRRHQQRADCGEPSSPHPPAQYPLAGPWRADSLDGRHPADGPVQRDRISSKS